MSVFSERLKNLRSRTGESQNDLGKALGKSRESVAKYEVGMNEPDLTSLANISKHFGVSVDFILGTTDNEQAIILTNPELKPFEPYLHDKNFVEYIKLAVKVKECGIDKKDIEAFIDNILKYSNNSKSSKQKHP